MAAPAQSGSNALRITNRVQLNVSHLALKDFFDSLERFKASLHGAAIGAHPWTVCLPDVNGKTATEVKFVAHRMKRAMKRSTPKVGAIAPCPPPEENAKYQAQRALQSIGVKRAFEDAFPGDTLDTALDVLADMIQSNCLLERLLWVIVTDRDRILDDCIFNKRLGDICDGTQHLRQHGPQGRGESDARKVDYLLRDARAAKELRSCFAEVIAIVLQYVI
jgi:hypothetical protein